jgi:hypothetical protein
MFLPHTSGLVLLGLAAATAALCCSCSAGSPATSAGSSPPAGKHLFVLSGQSNMAKLDPRRTFIPTVEAHFGADNVIVVKDAQGGRPIREWYRDWRPARGEKPAGSGELYDRLMSKVRGAIEGEHLQTVTFVWMQGEKDGRQGHGDVYAQSLLGLARQLEADLGRDDVNFVIGRLSDFDMSNTRYVHWTLVRAAQESLCRSRGRWSLVDTDDLNGPEDDLHYTAEGYDRFGRRLAEAAIRLVSASG